MEVYKITNKITGKFYIGSTSYDKETRFFNYDWGHIHSMSSGRKGELYDDMKKYGIDNFELETLEEVVDKSILYQRENYYIKLYWDKYGGDMMYNKQRGISSFVEGMKLTDEHRKHLSEAHTGVPLSESHKRAKRSKFHFQGKVFYGINELVEYLRENNINVTKDIIGNLVYKNYISEKNKKLYPQLLSITVDKIKTKREVSKK